MTHLNEEQQILAHYGEPLDEALVAHLEGCAECRAERDALAASLASIDDPVPDLPPTYEAEVWNRLRWHLRPAAPRVARRWLAAAAAALVLVSVGYVVGRGSRTLEPVPTASGRPAPGARSLDAARSAAMTSVVTDQVARSERLLTSLSNLSPGERDLDDERLTAERLLVSNRIQRAVARERGTPEVAALLDEIEPILLELVHSGSDLGDANLEALQARIKTRDLIFKLRVLASSLESTPINRRPSTPPSTRL